MEITYFRFCKIYLIIYLQTDINDENNDSEEEMEEEEMEEEEEFEIEEINIENGKPLKNKMHL